MKHKVLLSTTIITLLGAMVFIVWIFHYNTLTFHEAEATTNLLSVETHQGSTHSPGYKSYKQTIHLAAIGDVLIHDTVYEDAKTANNQYNFDPMFAGVKDLLAEADITVANQESMAGGTELGLSSYPCFNSPHEIIDTLVKSGVDIVTIANNHTLDRGEKGILSATNYYHKINLPYVGSYQNEADKVKPRILSRNGIKLGFLAYTYGTNGIPVPKGKDYLVNLIDEEKIHADIENIKPLVDVVVVSMHWGNEYQRIPTDAQKNLAVKLANDGADLIIGHHPHVLQPMEWIETNDGRKSFVAYSLGNFLSGQMWDYKDIGGVLNIEIVKELKDNQTMISLQNPRFTPTYVSSTHLRDYKVIPLENAASVGLPDAGKVNAEINQHMNQWLVSAQ